MVGKTLGPYKIIESLGAGGMGEVYLGEDTRLGRKVAVKVLPAEFASDPERLARFEQEARAAAALNHPHIAVVHDIGSEPNEDGGDIHFMVQEYLEGQSLRERLARGALPLDKALDIAIEIGEALIAAHKAGIIHRDLKPDNIFVTEEGHAKVLDFGLAKLTEVAAPRGSELTVSPTMLGTVAGQILGTAGYMAPEQVRCEAIDARADIFAFGCVLHEMVTGNRAFAGRTIHQTLDLILTEEPQQPAAPIPAPLDRIRRKCLDKDAARRYQHADDLAVDLARFAGALAAGGVELESAMGVASVGRDPVRVRDVLTSVPGVTMAGITVLALMFAALGFPRKVTDTRAVPEPVQLTGFTTAVTAGAVSPNGQMLAFVVAEPEGGDTQIWIKTLPDGPPQQLTHTPGVKDMPTFSRDGSHIAYTVFNGAWRWDTWMVPIVGGSPRLMMRNANSLTWTPDGRVIFSEFRQGLQLAIVMSDESGGNRREVWVPLPHQMAHYSDVSPDGERVVVGYMGVGPYSPESDACFERPIDGSDDDVRMIGGEYGCDLIARYSPDGEWIYFLARSGDVMREPAGGGTAEVVFEASTTMDPRTGFYGFDVAPDGRTLYLTAGGSSSNIWWQGPDGSREQLTYEGRATNPAFSADGRFVYYILKLPFTEAGPRVWRYERGTGQRDPVCPGLDVGQFTLSPDGRRLVAAVQGEGIEALWVCSPDGSEPSRRLVEAEGDQTDPVFSHDGRFVYYLQEVDAGREGPSRLDEIEARGATEPLGTLYRVGLDGSDARVIGDRLGLANITGVSPDGAFVMVTDLAATPAETWMYPTDGGEPRILMYDWELEWAPDNSSFLFVNRGMVTTSWVLENPAGEILPVGLPQRPDREWFESAGARMVLLEPFFSAPAMSTTPFEIAYGRVDFRSNLYRQDIVR